MRIFFYGRIQQNKQFVFHVEVEQKNEEESLTFFKKVFEKRLKCKLSNSHTTDCIFVALMSFQMKRKIQKAFLDFIRLMSFKGKGKYKKFFLDFVYWRPSSRSRKYKKLFYGQQNIFGVKIVRS